MTSAGGGDASVGTTPVGPLVRRAGTAPLYAQIRDLLRQKIQSGEFPPGTMIPAETELQRLFHVSRHTMRQALTALVEEGHLVRSRGRGTFVLQRRLEEPLPKLLSFTQEMRLRGAQPSTRVVKVAWVPPPPVVQEALHVAGGERVLRIERVRYADGAPIAVTFSHLPRWIGLTGREDFSGSLYEMLTEAGVKFAKAFQYIEAGRAGSRLARELNVPRGSPVLVLRRTLFADDGRAAEYVEGFYRADRYRYSIWLEP
ncbi:MAG: GntR family transcriptional regulator [Armatimonadota bacterium]|nr:GntR family transcriptional regulator [Armatimonadota bacterium]MDR7451539.1 GntR family transcriptional regulator [Armatimonadota bacterium]MDR7467506.1 GntR family transcriptional regulator [Armatimonadota bacterium]MDR7494380.1 GntR family transcriptional regulator [Armatimonadota bacterium]MDR7499197.1 GntR family transcriptional regulator [Armatimonadota bacterium]